MTREQARELSEDYLLEVFKDNATIGAIVMYASAYKKYNMLYDMLADVIKFVEADPELKLLGLRHYLKAIAYALKQ